MQDKLMKFDPATRAEKPYPSHARQWREYHGRVAWLFNPWTGKSRDARDIGFDVQGLLINLQSEDSSLYQIAHKKYVEEKMQNIYEAFKL